MTDYDRGYEDGQRYALRSAIEYLANPACNWMPSWKQPVYRVLVILASTCLGGMIPVSGEVHPEFGSRQLSVEDFVWKGKR